MEGKKEPTPLSAVLGKKFSLSNTERLESRAGIAAFELKRARLADEEASFLVGLGAKVLGRNGIALEPGAVDIQFKRSEDGGTVLEVEVSEPSKP